MTIIGVLIRHEAINDVLKTYISLSIGNGLLSLVPAYLVTIAVWCIVKREVRWYDKTWVDLDKASF